MFELKSDLSGGLETAEEEDFGPGKFAKHQKVCLLTCLQTISRACQSMFLSTFSNLQNIKSFVFSLVNTFSNLSMFMYAFSNLQNIKRIAFLCSLTLS